MEYSQPGDIVGAPALVDLDLDGEKEIIFTTQYGSSGSLYAITHDGTDIVGFPVNINEKMIAGPAVGDLDNDGSPDIVIVTWSDNIYAINNIGNVKEGFPVLSTERFSIAPILVDLDFDGDLEIIVGNDSGLLQIFEHTGAEVTSYDVGEDIRGGLSLSDLDNNGSLEVLFTGYDDLIHVWSPYEETELDGWPIDLLTNSVSEPLTADLDNDGDLEVIAASKNGAFFIFHHDGTSFNSFPTNLNSYIESTPAIADLDEDGDFEIAVGTSNGLHVFDIKTPKGDIPSWRLHRGNSERSGSLGFTLVKVIDKYSNIPEKFYVSSNYPNPFNPSTKFKISIIEMNNLIVDVYDANGRIVNSLINETIGPGLYEIVWDGKNQNGGDMATGVYFIRIQSGINMNVNKVLLIK